MVVSVFVKRTTLQLVIVSLLLLHLFKFIILLTLYTGTYLSKSDHFYNFKNESIIQEHILVYLMFKVENHETYK